MWVLAVIAFFFLPNLLVDFAYPALHPEDREAMVCVAMVWPTFLAPLLLVFSRHCVPCAPVRARGSASRSVDEGGGVTRPSNKGMKQTKPAQAMELRSLSPVLAGHADESEGPSAVDSLLEAWLAVQG